MKLWMKWMILGVVSILFGGFVLANPVAASIAVTLLVGIMFALIGGAQIYAGFGSDQTGSKVMGVGLGVLMLLLSASLIFRPLEGVLSLAMVATIFIGANGLLRIGTSWQMRETPMFWPMLLSGAFSILLAGYILANLAEVAPQLLGVLLGVELLFNGAGLIALAFFLRTVKGVMKEKIESRLKK